MLTEMNERGCTPEVCTYTCLIDGLLKANEANKALAILSETEKRGDTLPDLVTYHVVITWLVKQGRPQDALAILRKMGNVGCEPDWLTYIVLIDGLLDLNEVRDALGIMILMEKRERFPEYSTLERIYQVACDRIKNEGIQILNDESCRWEDKLDVAMS
ncbi:hypothetical protein L7F22_031829 [Adiantum nelumboides]|nr:hypothetical protein [Adiantum nelumboides]